MVAWKNVQDYEKIEKVGPKRFINDDVRAFFWLGAAHTHFLSQNIAGRRQREPAHPCDHLPLPHLAGSPVHLPPRASAPLSIYISVHCQNQTRPTPGVQDTRLYII